MTTQSLEVRIESRSPIWMTVSPDDIGRIFAAMSSIEQVAVLDAVVSAMEAHPTQWDYIAIEFGKVEHDDLFRKLLSIVRGMTP